jgi:hypothetical protein
MVEAAAHLTRLRRADSEAKAARVRAALEAMVAIGDPPGVSTLARRAGVSRRFIYDHPELRAEVAQRASQVADQHAGAVGASARVSSVSLRADLENAKARNRRLDVEIAALRRRLGAIIGREVLDEIGGVEDPTVAARVSQLEQALFESRENLARCTEELAAARQINRELMARLNR